MELARYPKKNLIIYGAGIAIGLIVYFLFCYYIGLIHLAYLRLFNLLIMAVGVYLAMRKFQLTHNDKVSFLRALSVGAATIVIGISAFVLFLFTLFQLDSSLFVTVVKHEPLGGYLNVYMASIVIWFEGTIAGMMATYIMVNFIKTDKE